VNGRALIDHSLDKLVEAGVSRAVVNVHYLPGQIEAHLAQRSAPATMISDEREALLETGGGMVKALPLIDADPFFCLNSDNVWLDGPQNVFAALSEAWNPAEMDALLLLVPHSRANNYKGVGDFHLDQMGRIRRRKPGHVAPYIYTGIQLLSRRLLADPPKGAFSTNVLWNRAMAEGRVYGISHLGLWFDVGTPAAIQPTAEALLDA